MFLKTERDFYYPRDVWNRFAFYIGMAAWFLLISVVYIQSIGQHMHEFGGWSAAALILLFMGAIPGGMLNMWWSQYIRSDQVVLQVLAFIMQLTLYVIPTIFWPQNSGDGVVTAIEVVQVVISALFIFVVRVAFTLIERVLSKLNISNE